MNDVANVIALIGNTSSYTDKKYILKKNQDLLGLKEALKFIFNPYFKTGISTAKLDKSLALLAERVPYKVGEDSFISFNDVMAYLTHNNTGTDASLLYVAKFINCTKALASSETVLLAKALVTQDLQIGVTSKTLNTVFGAAFIPTVGCMLGTKLEKVKNIPWPCLATEKLDGVRRILIKEKGKCRLFSRSGHEDFGLVDIIRDASYLPNNRVYDGELLAIGEFKDCIALRQATNSLSATKGEKHGLSFNVFDMLPIEDYYDGASLDGAIARKLILGATLMDESIQHLGFEDWPMYIASYGIHRILETIKSVPILGVINNMSEIGPVVTDIWARGGEGIMLNTWDSFYEIKRSKHLIKVKNTEEHVLPIVDMIEGTNKYEGMLGSLIVEYRPNETERYTVGVGSGFNDRQRAQMWAHKEDFIGMYVEIDTFGMSTNKFGTKSLNCPIFKRLVSGVD